MWNSKMATQWRGKDEDLNAGNSNFLGRNPPSQSVLCGADVVDMEMDPQSCMDHSILAIFEDISSKDKSGVEEENETLLSALTEMLDHVEDGPSTLSPFDMLPDTKLLTYQQCKEESAREVSPAEKEEQRQGNGTEQATFHLKKRKAESEVEVFTSSSLSNLIKLMHPYCLRLHIEEGRSPARSPASTWQKVKKKQAVFCQEEVWKYEKPSGDTDEEINVVSDDDVPHKETKKEEEREAAGAHGKLLKGVLLRGISTREKKKVSFGPIQVASFIETDLTSGVACAAPVSDTEALGSPAGPAAQISGNECAALPGTGETKAKALSLKEYRQRRHQRLPAAEKTGNYTTKWPSVSEPPRELTPILCSYGKTLNNPITFTALSAYSPHPPGYGRPPHHVCSSEDKWSAPKRCSRFKNTRGGVSESSPGQWARVTAVRCDRRKSPLRKVVSSDPPNPVLLPLPVPQTAPAENELTSQPEQDWSPVSTRTTSGRSTGSLSPSTALIHSSAEHKKAQDVQLTTCPSSHHTLDPPIGEEPSAAGPSFSLPEEPQCLQVGCGQQSSTGIEAPDVTSLLEQFEETQTNGGGVSEKELKPEHKSKSVGATLHLPTQQDPDRTSVPPSADMGPLRTTGDESDPQTLDIPELLGSEITLSTWESLSARCSSAPAKAIQIIEPRPLPSKNTSKMYAHGLSGHMWSVASDHDYCMPVDQSPAGVTQCGTADVPDSTDEVQRTVNTHLPEDRCGALSAPCSLLTPPPSPPRRARDKRRYHRSPHRESSTCSSSSFSSSSSTSRSPKRQRLSRRRRSRSRSWSPSPSLSRSPSPPSCRRCWRDICRHRESQKLRWQQEARVQKLKAIDERRVVYVGRIRRSMTHHELRERFSQFGEVECVSLHFRDKGDHYGFVTFYNIKDAFSAINNGRKLRRPDELPFDICFGGRRQFCNSDYADLDANQGADPSPVRSKSEELDFDSLLRKAQRGLKSKDQ